MFKTVVIKSEKLWSCISMGAGRIRGVGGDEGERVQVQETGREGIEVG